MTQFEQWNGFEGRLWKEEINVRDFIQKNYKPYDGDESFLAGPTGGFCRSCRRKNAPRAVYWIWTPTSFRP